MEVVGGIPIECLTAGELAGVWSGWSSMGDREVVREASAKGTHLKLAYKFLAHRRGWTAGKAQKYFYSEAEVWINELLKKHQFHRACHILKNLGKDPLPYICKICVESTESDLRDYLSNCIASNNGFTDVQIEAWQIINCIKKYEEKYSLNNKSLGNISINEIVNLSPKIKNALLTEIYFHTCEPCLSDKLKSEVVWEYLLSYEKVELLNNWISNQYDNNKRNIVIGENDLSEIFSNLEITDEMIDVIELSITSVPVKEILLNHLCQYGVFTKKERENVKLVLSRFMSAMITPLKFKSILHKKSCNLDVDNFTSKIHSILYYQTVNEDEIDRELYLKDKKLLDMLQSMDKVDIIDQKLFNNAVCQTIYHVSSDFDQFLKDNPLITLYLVLCKYQDILIEQKENNLTETPVTLEHMLNDKNGLVIEDFTINPQVIEQLKYLPYLKNAIAPIPHYEDITMYQFLHGYENLNVHELFEWRQKNETIPNFTSKNLIKKYGHKEKLTYKYYLKEARPSMAAYILQNSRSKMQIKLSTKKKMQIAFYAHIFGLKNMNNPEIITTCIAFIEFLGVESECLRFHATAATYVQNQLNISINELLESIIYYQNSKDIATVMRHLEHSFANEFTATSMNDVSNFVSSLKSWHFILQFAIIHNTTLPSKFLEYLAKNNLWIEFVLTAHIFEYSPDQTLEIAAKFKNRNIREHLLISLTNSQLLGSRSIHNSDKKSISRDDKCLILSKMKSKCNTSYSATSPLRSNCVNNRHENNKLITNPLQYFPLNQTISPFDCDLWLTILKCHQSQDPPRALLKEACKCKSSILIVLAACYEPSSIAAFCYSWLVISTKNEKLIENYNDCLNDQLWPAIKVSNLFREIISLGFIDTIRRGLQIFMPTNPLREFFEFLIQYVKYYNYELCEKSLVNFTNFCVSLKRNKMINWHDIETIYLNNEYWIATVAIESIFATLSTCLRSTHLQIKFLNIFIEHDFNNALCTNSIDFKILLKVVKCLATTDIKIDFTAMTFSVNEYSVMEEIKKCIQKLIESKNFNGALKLSNIANLPCSKIILDQYRSEFSRYINENKKITVTFWKKCAVDIEKYNVDFEDAAAFFIEHAECVISYKERYEILQLALKILQPISTDQQTIDTVEMAMWKSCILAGPESIEIANERKTLNKLKTELLSSISNLRVNCTLTDEAGHKTVETLINRYIDHDDLETALRLNVIFNCKHNDIKILMLCLSIAEGEVSPYELNSHQKALLLETPNSKQQKYLTLENPGHRRHQSDLPTDILQLPSPTKNIQSNNDVDGEVITRPILQRIQMDCINLLERLVNNLQHGLNLGKQILLLYKLSAYLKKSYPTLLVLQDPMEILYEITGMNFPEVDKFRLIHDTIAGYRIKNTEVSKFFAGEWLLHITRQVEDDQLNVNLRVITNFSVDASLLGWELLRNANLRLGHSYGAKRDICTLKIVIELLILAHDYFTASCNMEGIASVLRKCQNVVNTLQHSKLWSLLVRLVTGIGRFTEMNYVFQILKENDQFEYLLRKGLDKCAGLKMALLEFCKRQSPENKELLNLVVSHFQLYNESAIMWENEAKTVIRELIKETRKEYMKLSNLQSTIKFMKNDKTGKTLQLAMANFTHATELYLKDEKLNLANRCACQAQLVALQLSLFNNIQQNHEVTCLLNLTTEEINKAMCQSLSFQQTLILVQAYNHNADWSSILYHRVIVNTEIRYLKDFLTFKPLTSAIVQDCVCRYRMEKHITKQMTINMQSLISELNDIECKYVLASQLGFKNMIQVLISNATTGAYLRDTIWKQGFHPQEFIGENFRT